MTDRIEIERLAKYITDDGAIANYLQIDRAEVASIRATMWQPKHIRFKPERTEGTRSSRGNKEETNARSDAKHGSESMRVAILESLDRYARRHRITRQEAGRRMISEGRL